MWRIPVGYVNLCLKSKVKRLRGSVGILQLIFTLLRGFGAGALMITDWRRPTGGEVLAYAEQELQYDIDDWDRRCFAHKLETRMSRLATAWTKQGSSWFPAV